MALCGLLVLVLVLKFHCCVFRNSIFKRRRVSVRVCESEESRVKVLMFCFFEGKEGGEWG